MTKQEVRCLAISLALSLTRHIYIYTYMLAHAVSLTHPHSFSASSIVHEHKVMDECNITPSPIHAFACSPVHNVRRLSSVYVLLFSFIHLFWILNCFRYSLEHRICQAQPPRRGNSNGRSQRKAVLLSFIFFPFLFLSIIFVLHLWVSLLYFSRLFLLCFLYFLMLLSITFSTSFLTPSACLYPYFPRWGRRLLPCCSRQTNKGMCYA